MKSFDHVVPYKINNVSRCSGGCIGNSYIVDTEKGKYFLKEYSKIGISNVEAKALNEMAGIQGVNVPLVIAVTDRVLLLSYINEGCKTNSSQKELGYMLAALHSKDCELYGYSSDNFIGLTPQKNDQVDSWPLFYRNNRLRYQINLCKNNGFMDVVEAYEAIDHRVLDLLSGDIDRPTLLHGDLWGGNVIYNTEGVPYFIDPASYYGTREADLAMTYIFGGFTRDFYHSYMSMAPLHSGWKDRLALYKLYHILNHLNLFGSSYRAEALQLINIYN